MIITANYQLPPPSTPTIHFLHCKLFLSRIIKSVLLVRIHAQMVAVTHIVLVCDLRV